MGNKNAINRTIARIASQQHGLITAKQLATAGLGRSGASRRARAGLLHRVYRGVYAVGTPYLSREARWLAAVLACGPGAVLSHHSAADLWGLRKERGGPVHVTTPGSGGRERRRGIVVHRSPALAASMTTRRQGISVTTPTRTITDLRRLLPRDQLNNILREAEAKRLPIGDLAEAELGRSELEVKFLALCRGHHLPEPAVNAQVGQFEVDFLWRDRRVIVETDGYRFHGTRAAFERDRERDARLTLLGFEVVRFSFSQVTSRPQWVASTVEQLLEGRRPEPPVPLPKIGSWPREPPTATNPSSF